MLSALFAVSSYIVIIYMLCYEDPSKFLQCFLSNLSPIVNQAKILMVLYFKCVQNLSLDEWNLKEVKFQLEFFGLKQVSNQGMCTAWLRHNYDVCNHSCQQTCFHIQHIAYLFLIFQYNFVPVSEREGSYQPNQRAKM